MQGINSKIFNTERTSFFCTLNNRTGNWMFKYYRAEGLVQLFDSDMLNPNAVEAVFSAPKDAIHAMTHSGQSFNSVEFPVHTEMTTQLALRNCKLIVHANHPDHNSGMLVFEFKHDTIGGNLVFHIPVAVFDALH